MGACRYGYRDKEDNKKYKVKVINFPKLAYRERNIIDQRRMTFASALQEKEFGVIGRQRVKNF